MQKLAFSLLLLFITTCSFSQTNFSKLIDTANMDLSIKPGDDFYHFVNGNWLKKTEIPASKTSWGTFTILAENSSLALKAICEDAVKKTNKNRSQQMVADFYTSGMDSMNAEKLGYSPIKKDLERISKIKTINDILNEITYQHTKGITSPLFNFYVEQDAKKTTQYITFIDQGGLVLPDRDYYLKSDARFEKIRGEYRSYITDLFIFTGTDSISAKQNAANIFSFETKLAEASLSKLELRDPIKTYNKLNIDELSKSTPNIAWRGLLQKMLVSKQDSMLVNNPTFLKTIDTLLSTTSIDTWKAYLQWYILKSSASYLSNQFVERAFKYGQALSGQKAMTPRWQKMTYQIDNKLGDVLGQLYVEKYFNAAAKKRMMTLVNNLQISFKERIKKLDWMSAETKTKALAKLNAFAKKIGYPDKWKDYKGVVITKDNLLQNIRNSAAWRYNYLVKRLDQPIDKSEWYYTPQTVNAYYAPLKNEIAFLAAILQPPFFDPLADDAVNYGSIGAVIGHEMTHGFDDQGRQYDLEGNLNDWWQVSDSTNFKARTDKVVAQFNGYKILDTIQVNGELTLGENIADLGGLAIAYDAFKRTAQGQTNKKIEGYTPDQRFFISWARAWRSKMLPETAIRLNNTDVHPPNEFRAIAPLVNMAEFYRAFNINVGDKMYKPAKERVKIW
ncbi:MAG: M13 family metallopeptidase [Bacteroidota bacterium]